MPTMSYAEGTELRTRGPWGVYSGGRALCPDGKVRALARIARTADTIFSVPAAVKVRGRTVSGFVSVSSMSGSDVTTDGDPAVIRFTPYLYGRNHDAFGS